MSCYQQQHVMNLAFVSSAVLIPSARRFCAGDAVPHPRKWAERHTARGRLHCYQDACVKEIVMSQVAGCGRQRRGAVRPADERALGAPGRAAGPLAAGARVHRRVACLARPRHRCSSFLLDRCLRLFWRSAQTCGLHLNIPRLLSCSCWFQYRLRSFSSL